MDLNLLNRLFKIGRIFALTPASINNQNPNLFQKCHQFLILFLYTGCLIVAKIIVYSPYYRRLTSVHKILLIFMNLNFYAHSFYVLIVLMVTRRSRWFKLIHNLQCVDSQFNFLQKSHWLIIVLAHVIFCIIISSRIYIYLEFCDLTFAGLNIIECFENYSLLFCAICSCVVLNLLLSRYKHQNLLLTKPRIDINEVKYNLYMLRETVNIYNDIFGWTTLLNIFDGALKCLRYIDIMVKDKNIWTSLLIQIGILATVLLSDAILKEYEKIFNVVFKMQYSSDDKQCRSVFSVVLHNRPEFTAARFFVIDRSALFAIFNGIITFLLVVLQYRST
ncbi:7tm 7 domain containing protein [Asbolus verrucosus]|uniref:7tm 7 domain containing protein n=1 Tax=Asbolus verrucosus TaxID=1661398 RepID=A0A482VA97_ASBVE|nr:7tm 7 domain containing protein [Asbolus verrucosus]